ncbi:MAG: TPM domain-containing protein [Synechococcales bacterium]|nr:TPM domain-containing protein [Synechococcales bacterium]
MKFFPFLRSGGRGGCRLLAIALVCCWQLWAMPAIATNLSDLPAAPEAHVVDNASILSLSTEGQINSSLKDLQSQVGQEVYIVTVRGLDYDETSQSFTEKLFQAWFPEPSDQAKTTLLLIDSQTDDTGIVTGPAVKSVMSDAIATSVAKETVLVPLKFGNRYNQSMLDANERLVTVLSGKADPGAPDMKETVNVESTFATPEETEQSNATVWVIVLLVLATAIPMATYYLYLYLGNRS